MNRNATERDIHRKSSQAASGCQGSLTSGHPEVLPLFLQLLTIPVHQARPTEHGTGCKVEPSHAPGAAHKIRRICSPALLNRCLGRIRTEANLCLINFFQGLIVLGIVEIQKHVGKANQSKPQRSNVILQPTGYNETDKAISLLPFQPMQKLILQVDAIVHGKASETDNTIERPRKLPFGMCSYTNSWAAKRNWHVIWPVHLEVWIRLPQHRSSTPTMPESSCETRGVNTKFYCLSSWRF